MKAKTLFKDYGLRTIDLKAFFFYLLQAVKKGGSARKHVRILFHKKTDAGRSPHLIRILVSQRRLRIYDSGVFFNYYRFAG
jgi:hypothetical protein